MNRGHVVDVDWPFSELTGTKRRPASARPRPPSSTALGQSPVPIPMGLKYAVNAGRELHRVLITSRLVRTARASVPPLMKRPSDPVSRREARHIP